MHKQRYVDLSENNEVHILKAQLDNLQEIIACCYQLAGLVDAPLVWLDVLSDPLSATREQIDQMIPITINPLTKELE